MIKNMTIEQLMKTDVIEEVDEALTILIKKLNELNQNKNITYCLTEFEDNGELELPSLENINKEAESDYYINIDKNKKNINKYKIDKLMKRIINTEVDLHWLIIDEHLDTKKPWITFWNYSDCEHGFGILINNCYLVMDDKTKNIFIVDKAKANMIDGWKQIYNKADGYVSGSWDKEVIKFLKNILNESLIYKENRDKIQRNKNKKFDENFK